MDRLWTPWRFDYIRGISEPGECVFCRILSEHRDQENFVLWRGKHSFIILNLFPYTSGHILIVANRHISFLSDASPDELHDILDAAQKCEKALVDEYKPEGFNLGFNLHMHLLPRWTGDSNFVSIVGETRVLPEELPRSYSRLLPHFA